MMLAIITLALLSSPREASSPSDLNEISVKNTNAYELEIDVDDWVHTFPETVAVAQPPIFVFGVSAVSAPIVIPTYDFQKETPEICTGAENPFGETPPWYSEFDELRERRPMFEDTYGGFTLDAGFSYLVNYEHKKYVTPGMFNNEAKDRLNLFNASGEAQFPALLRDLNKVTDPILKEEVYEHTGGIFPAEPGDPHHPGQGGGG